MKQVMLLGVVTFLFSLSLQAQIVGESSPTTENSDLVSRALDAAMRMPFFSNTMWAINRQRDHERNLQMRLNLSDRDIFGKSSQEGYHGNSEVDTSVYRSAAWKDSVPNFGSSDWRGVYYNVILQSYPVNLRRMFPKDFESFDTINFNENGYLDVDSRLFLLKILTKLTGPNRIEDLHAQRTVLHEILTYPEQFPGLSTTETTDFIEGATDQLLGHPEIDLTLTDINRRTVMHQAALYRPELLDRFIAAGVDPLAKDALGHTALDYVKTFSEDPARILQKIDLAMSSASVRPNGTVINRGEYSAKSLSIADISDPFMLRRSHPILLIERELADEGRRSQFINDLVNTEKYSVTWRWLVLQYALEKNHSFGNELLKGSVIPTGCY